MTDFSFAVSDHRSVVRTIPSGAVPDFDLAIQAFRRAKRDSVAHALSLEFPNFMCRARAEALAMELLESGFRAPAEVLVRAMVEAGELDDVLLRRAP